MRIRTIKPDFFFDDKLAELPYVTRLAFEGLWVHADREGRLVDNAPKLKALIFPYDKVNMENELSKLSKKPFIYRYSVNGSKYIQIVNWTRHQRVHHAEPLSTIPEYNGDTSVLTPCEDGSDTVSDTLGKEGKGKEGKGVCTPLKVKHLDFVYLAEKEYQTLCDNIGKGNTDHYIASLNDYIGAKGKKYNSHYHVISGWYRKDHPDERPKRQL